MRKQIPLACLISLLAAACSGGGSTPNGTAGTTGSAGATSTAGATGSAGATATAGATGTAGAAGSTGNVDAGASDAAVTTKKFSFFATSLAAIKELSKNDQGFGGDLRFGETGLGAGLRGADKICATIAEKSLPGSGAKGWRAFLSAVAGEDGKQVDAIDRVGDGPWYDRLGRTVALTKADLVNDRPKNCDPVICNDLPNEDGVPNHKPDPTMPAVDNHDFLTGTNNMGKLYSATATCADWTGSTGNEGKPRVGHTWPRSGGPGRDGGAGDGGPPGGSDGGLPGGSGVNWMSALDESGCAPGINIIENGPPDRNSNTVGSGGGYGGIYCFALTP
jgi:hypothetical protein